MSKKRPPEKKPIEKMLSPVILHLEDLHTIENILKEIHDKISFDLNGYYEMYSVDELQREVEEDFANNLLITAISLDKSSWMKIHINRSFVGISTNSDSIVSTGVFSKLKSLLSSKKRKIVSIVFGAWIKVPLYLAFFYGFFICMKSLKEDNLTMLYIAVPFLFFVMIYSNILEKFNRSIICLNSCPQKPSLWETYKREIIVAIISAITGALVTLIGSMIFEIFIKKML